MLIAHASGMPALLNLVHDARVLSPRASLGCVAALIFNLACSSATTGAPTADGGSAGSSQSGAAGNANGGNGQGGSASGASNGQGGNGQGGTAPGTAGNGGGGLGGGGAAGHASGGVGGRSMSVPPCPGAAPTSGDSCGSNGQRCFYEDCTGAGRSVATCVGGAWSVEVGACEPVQCSYPSNMMCQTGQLCSVSAGGALLVSCLQNSCGKGPITCACAGSCADCAITGSLSLGVSLTCNACPSGTCA